MRFADYKLKSIQEAVNTAPQMDVDMSHLEDKSGMSGGGYEDPMSDPAHQQALAKAQAWEDQVVNSPGGEGKDNDDDDDDKDKD